MSDYVIKGQTSDENGRLVIINESDWTVEVDETPVPNFVAGLGTYYAEVTNSKKLVFIRKTDGQIKSYGNVDPFLFWDEKTNNTFWENDGLYSPTLTWNGSAWTGTNSGGTTTTAALKVPVAATWADGYKPLYVKIEYTLSGGGDTADLNVVGCCGRGTTSSSSSIVAPVTSGEGIPLLTLWESLDDISGITFKVPAGETLTITGIYFSKTKYKDTPCDGYGYSNTAFDEATALTGTEPDFSGGLEIIGQSTLGGATWDYNAGSFTVTSTAPIRIKVESTTPKKPPRVSIFSDRDTQLIGSNTSGAGWHYSGTNVVEFDWVPPATGSYAVMVKNASNLGAGKECDTFSITISEVPGGGEGDCEAYTTETMHANAKSELVLGQETTYNVDFSGGGDRLAIEMPTLSGTDENLVVSANSDGSFKIVAYEKTTETIYGWTDYCDPQYGIPSHGYYSNGDLYSNPDYDSPAMPNIYGSDGCTVEYGNGSAGSGWLSGFNPEYAKVTFTGNATTIRWLIGATLYSNPSPDTYWGPDNPIDSGDIYEFDPFGGSLGTLMTFEAVAEDSFTITSIEMGDATGTTVVWTNEVEVTSSGNNVISALIPTTDTSYDFIVNDYRLGIINTEGSCIECNLTVTASGAASGGLTWEEKIDAEWWADVGSITPTPGLASADMGGGTHVLYVYPDFWQPGYLPSKMRISFVGAATVDLTYELTNYEGGPNEQTVLSYSSGQEIDLTWESSFHVLGFLQLVNNGDNSFEVISVEFLAEPVECANYSTASAALDAPEITEADLYDTQIINVNPGKYAAIEYSNGMGFSTDVMCENRTENTDFDVYTFDSSKSQSDYSNGTGQGGEHEAYLSIPDTSPCYIVIHNVSGTECGTIAVSIGAAT